MRTVYTVENRDTSDRKFRVEDARSALINYRDTEQKVWRDFRWEIVGGITEPEAR